MYENSRQQRVDIFEDTMHLCRSIERLSQAIGSTVERTRLYPPEDSPQERRSGLAGTVTVTQERSFEAARRLHNESPESKICVLNFASATNPGGGVKKGSSAQEEALCRCSTLYPCLNTNRMFPQYYAMHRQRMDHRYTDTCIYTPDITVFKTDTAFPELMQESAWFSVDIITCAAPNLRWKPNNMMNPGRGEAVKMSDAELLALHLQRGRHILDIAAANGADILVLGAFGCGAFQNPPRVVASAYKELLAAYRDSFQEVCFAVYCPPDHPENYRVFREILT